MGELSVRLARPRVETAPPAAVVTSGPPSAHAATSPAAPAPARDVTPFGAPAPGMHFVNAPLTGVWYASPSPEARPYLQVGSEVAEGQVIGLIEAMKLFNEIKCDRSGRVIRILVEKGNLVKRKQTILEYDPR